MRVLGARGVWVSIATSHRGRRLRPTLPETHDGPHLSASGSPQACGCPCSIIGWWGDDVVCHHDQFILVGWAYLFSL
jgi:hypothetical protein